MTLIKREDAIDELRHLIPYKKYHRGEWVYLLERKEVFKALNALPSAEADWIPCSERLPEKNTPVLVFLKPRTAECIFPYHIGSYDHAVWFLKNSLTHEKYPNDEADVIAWMPLPKPYKAESEEV